MAYVTYEEATDIYATLPPQKVYTYSDGSYTYTDVFNATAQEDLERFLEAATTLIDQQTYVGYVSASATGTNQFPRNTDTTVPVEVKQACVVIALALAERELVRQQVSPEMVAERDFGVNSVTENVGDSSRSTSYKPEGNPMDVATPYLRKWFKKAYKLVSYNATTNVATEF